jgi:hypothetical protein
MPVAQCIPWICTWCYTWHCGVSCGEAVRLHRWGGQAGHGCGSGRLSPQVPVAYPLPSVTSHMILVPASLLYKSLYYWKYWPLANRGKGEKTGKKKKTKQKDKRKMLIKRVNTSKKAKSGPRKARKSKKVTCLERLELFSKSEGRCAYP